MSGASVPQDASNAVLLPSHPIPVDTLSVEGPNFECAFSVDELLGSYERIGFQATSLGRAIQVVDKMVSNPYPKLFSMSAKAFKISGSGG